MENNFSDIIYDLSVERKRQMDLGYDVAHDRTHTAQELSNRIMKYYKLAFDAKIKGDLDTSRKAFIKAGAMNIALIQVIDSFK